MTLRDGREEGAAPIDDLLARLFRRAEGAVYRFKRIFKPNQRCLRQVRYRGADFLVLANEDIGWVLVAHKTWEEAQIRLLEGYIGAGDICLDIGANIGLYSVFMGRKAGSGGRVYAFEPVRLNQKILELNLELNGIDNVVLMDCVVSDQEGEIDFSVSSDAAYSSIRPTNRYEESRCIKKHSITLDGFVRDLNNPVGVIKIDVEGAEVLVLRGGKHLLSDPDSRPRAVLTELNAENMATYGYGPKDIICFMEECGYAVYSITRKGLQKGWPTTGCAGDVMFLPAFE